MNLTLEEKRYAMDFTRQYDNLERRSCTLEAWLAVKFSCDAAKAKALAAYARALTTFVNTTQKPPA